MQPTEEFIESVLEDYIKCALWSSSAAHPETGEMVNLDAADLELELADETREKMRADVVSFLNLANEADVTLWQTLGFNVGHDFWLTRNQHGTGFWDRGYGLTGNGFARARNALDDIAQSFDECDLYISDDDGLIYA